MKSTAPTACVTDRLAQSAHLFRGKIGTSTTASLPPGADHTSQANPEPAMTWLKYFDGLAMTLGVGCLIGLALGMLVVRV
jgi:hypothetical protein